MKRIHPNLFVEDGSRVRTIEEFAGMDVPAMEPNECGVFEDAVMVDIPVKRGYALLVLVARDSTGGYYASDMCATPTGANTWLPSIKGICYPSKDEAFHATLRKALGRCEMRGMGRSIREANRKFYNLRHEQLNLFE